MRVGEALLFAGPGDSMRSLPNTPRKKPAISDCLKKACPHPAIAFPVYETTARRPGQGPLAPAGSIGASAAAKFRGPTTDPAKAARVGTTPVRPASGRGLVAAPPHHK